MAISKITLNGEVQMDVTQDTVTTNNLLSGETATGADGVRLTGTLIPSSEPVLQAKTVTPTSSEQVIVPDGYACTPSIYTSNAQSYSAGALISSAVFFYSGSLIEEQTYRVLGRLDVVDASGTVLEYYDIDSEFIWNTTYQDVLINGATEYVQYLKLGKGPAYNRVNLLLKLNLAGTFGFTLKIYFYEENASYDGLSQVTVNPIPSQYIIPSGTKTITENGTGIDVASYASVDVNVSGGGGGGEYDATLMKNYIERSTSFTDIDWPDGLTSIGGYAFSDCTQFRPSSPLPDGVTTISTYAFNGCTNLALTSLPSGLTSIGNYAFAGCRYITLSSLPSGVTSIGFGAFNQCDRISTITCDGPITSLQSLAFTGTSMSLSSVSFPNMSLSSLPTAFGSSTATNACHQLAYADIGSTKDIASNAFANCYALQTLILRRSDAICSLGNVSAFLNTPMRGYNSLTGTVYVPSALISTYQTATNWATLYNGGTVTFAAIEGSEYELD